MTLEEADEFLAQDLDDDEKAAVDRELYVPEFESTDSEKEN